jgi:hypothetical protein
VAVNYVGVNTDTVVSAGTTSTTISSFPAGHAAGNLMMLHVRSKNSGATAPTFTVDQGFTLSTRSTALNASPVVSVVNEIWFKVAEGTAGTEPQPTVTASFNPVGDVFGVSLYEFTNTVDTYLAGPTALTSPNGTGTGLFTPASASIIEDGLAFVAFIARSGGSGITTTQGFTSVRTYSASIFGETAYKSVTPGTVTFPTFTRASTVDATCAISLVFGVTQGVGWSVGRIKY